jgi:DeoR/GlpR family transcriptional regulator of sugar metabolism
MNIMSQEYHFNPFSTGIGVKELQSKFNYKPETIRNKLKTLCERGLIEKVSGKPVKYVISKSYLES